MALVEQEVDVAARVSGLLCELASTAVQDGWVTMQDVIDVGCLHPAHITMTAMAAACDLLGLDAATVVG